MLHTELTHEDALKIVEIGKQLHAESHFNSEPYDVNRVWRLLQHTTTMPRKVFICYDKIDNDIRGFVIGYIQDHFFSGVSMAQDFCVYIKPEYRGVGKLFHDMINSFEQWAKDCGASSVTIYHNTGINTENAPRLFSRLGYANRGYIFAKELS